MVLQLDGQPALEVLLDTLKVSLDGDPQEAVQRVRHTLAGLMDADGVSQAGRTGHFGTDTRVRHIIGLDGARHGAAVADHVEPGMRLAFCQRNAAAARADLVRICAEIREELEPQELEPIPQPARADADMAPVYGALGAVQSRGRGAASRGYLCELFRAGGPHFGAPGAELQIVRHALGDVPLAGFFLPGARSRTSTCMAIPGC